jgi:hypothetical protein
LLAEALVEAPVTTQQGAAVVLEDIELTQGLLLH